MKNATLIARLQNTDTELLRTELYNLGYRATADNGFWGVDQMDENDIYDTLLEYYTQYPELALAA